MAVGRGEISTTQSTRPATRVSRWQLSLYQREDIKHYITDLTSEALNNQYRHREQGHMRVLQRQGPHVLREGGFSSTGKLLNLQLQAGPDPVNPVLVIELTPLFAPNSFTLKKCNTYLNSV